jgi:hypothetical protein
VRRIAPGVIVLMTVIVLVGCGSSVSPSPPLSAAPAAVASPPSPSLPAPASTAPPSTATSPIPTDDALLELLPAELDGLDRQVDASVNASIARDPDLARLARSFATALYIDPATSEFAYVSVIRLKDRLSAEQARSYRDSFDAAACSQAGGLVRTAEATIGSHAAHIGTCAGGVRTYHIELEGGAMILSVSEAGERRLAERLIKGVG